MRSGRPNENNRKEQAYCCFVLQLIVVYVVSGGSRISRRGGVDLVGGPWTPEAATFRKFRMSKRKNLDP